MHLHDLLGHGEPEAGTTRGLGQRAVDLMELLEDAPSFGPPRPSLYILATSDIADVAPCSAYLRYVSLALACHSRALASSFGRPSPLACISARFIIDVGQPSCAACSNQRAAWAKSLVMT